MLGDGEKPDILEVASGEGVAIAFGASVGPGIIFPLGLDKSKRCGILVLVRKMDRRF
jgi:hypothetical protein